MGLRINQNIAAMNAYRNPTGGERDGLPLLRAWPVVPDEPWVRAWSGGTDRAGAVHVGNVAEFNAWLGCPPQGRDHYSCLAVFATPRPAAIVLPEPVDHSWIAGLADTLGWAEVTVHSGVARDGRGSDALQADGSLVGDGSAGGDAPLIVPWGRTPAFQRVAPVPADVLAAIRRYESKRGAHALFERLAPGHRGIGVPAQRMARSRRELIRELRRARRARASIVLKREYGVGGFGTLVINADTPARRLRSAARRWGRGATLVEEYVAGAGPFRDLTFDAVIDGDGDVHVVGTGLMAVDGTSYQGVTVGPGVLPGALAETAARFGTAVGRALAADGYRGWYDVDFVTGQDGLLHPTEVNLRLTGPAAAFMIKARLDRVRGGRHLVRTLDHLPLGARLPPRALREHLDLVAAACHRIGALAFATIPTAAFEHFPYIGMALAARTAAELDQAEAVVRSANDALRELFAGLLPGHETPAARGRRPGSAASRSVVL